MTERFDRRRLHGRRRRRRLLRGTVRIVFWALILAAVFVLGLGYGRTIAGGGSGGGGGSGTVTIEQPLGPVEATLPTRTVTTTRTVTVRAPARRGARAAAARR